MAGAVRLSGIRTLKSALAETGPRISEPRAGRAYRVLPYYLDRMSFDHEQREGAAATGESAPASAGKRTRTQSLPAGGVSAGAVQLLASSDGDDGARAARDAQTRAWLDEAVRPDLHGKGVQRAADGAGPDAETVHRAAAHGVSGAGGSLPFLDTIQRSFGHHDVGHVSAHVGGAAAEAAQGMGAQAYAVGGNVAFRSTPDLHTAAHEAAHVVQQRAGVHLKGGVGEVGDPYERHADAVADRVVRGESAEGLLDEMSGGGDAEGVQMLATYGGDFEATNYNAYTSGTLRGTSIEITFTPGELVVSPKVGLVQTVKSTKNGVNNVDFGPPSEQAERAGRGNTAAQGDAGRYIDRTGERTNPMYGMDNNPAGASAGTTTTSGAGNGRFGHRNVVAGVVDMVPAWMFDRPAMNWAAGTAMEQIFEATALALEGPMAGTYFGSVEWGVQTDAASGTPTPMPFRVLSQGTPSAQFMASAENWNAQSIFMRDNVVAAGPGTVASLGAVVPGTVYPANTLLMTITTGAGPVEVRTPIEATFDAFRVAAGAAVIAGQVLAVYRNQHETTDLTTTTHQTVDPTSLDDAALERRMRELCDEILPMDRTAPDYQNKRFEIRGLGQTAVTRGTDAVDSGHTYTVRGGDTLWGIAAAHLGGGPHWTRIMALNVVDIGNPNIIHVGAVLKMPEPYHS